MHNLPTVIVAAGGTVLLAAEAFSQPVLPPSLQWIVLVGGVVAAAGVVWRKVGHPLVKLVSLAEDAIPMLEEMTYHFKPNGGDSLYDILRRIQSQLTEVNDLLDIQRKDHDELVARVNGIDGLIAEARDGSIEERALEALKAVFDRRIDFAEETYEGPFRRRTDPPQ